MSFSALSPGWKIENNKLIKEFNFGNFMQAMTFVNQVADLAEQESHHPGIIISYSQVIVSLSTHDANDITEKDYSLAKKIDAIS